MSLETFPIVTVGHVDHGKSTIVGHLLAKLGSLPDGKLEQIRKMCEKQQRPFEYAFILDALREEQKQGITIDTARIFFNTAARSYQLLDAPGHVEFIKNMVTGASRAEAALLVVDAIEGVKENSRRHAYLLGFLGITQIIVLVNKMDGVQFSEQRFLDIQTELNDFLKTQKIYPRYMIPVSGLLGDNLVSQSASMPWWTGPSVVEALDEFKTSASKSTLPLRTVVQDVYKFESSGAERRIVAGAISSGTLKVGDEIQVWPTGEKTSVLSLEGIAASQPQKFLSRDAASFILKDSLFVTRGQLITSPAANITTGKNWTADIFWLGKQSLQVGKSYILRVGPLKTLARIEKITKVLNTADLDTQISGADIIHEVQTNQAAEILFSTTETLSVDLTPEQSDLTRFVIVDNFEISGGGKLLAPAQAVSRSLSFKHSPPASNLSPKTKSYTPHVLLIQSPDETTSFHLGEALAQAYDARSIPLVAFSTQELNVFDVQALSARIEGVQLAGGCAVLFISDSKDESLRTLVNTFSALQPFTVAEVTPGQIHAYPADLVFRNGVKPSTEAILEALEQKGLLLKNN